MSSPDQYQLIVGQVSSGGDLATRLSLDNVGPSNYAVKRDWRRETDGEIRREGDLLFAPNSNVPANLQSLPGDTDPIILVHFSRKPNGQTGVIVGTQTTLYRYFSFEDGEVYANGCYTTDVYEDVSGAWITIADNCSVNGHRWEAVEVAGRTIFSNGVDLPLVYDLGWLKARPLYELREEGIAFVGTIAEFNGMLLVGDVAEINDLDSVMNGRFVSSMSQVGSVVNSTVGTFTSADVGSTIVWGTAQTAKILTVVSPTICTVDNSQTAPLGPVQIAILYGTISDPTKYSRVQYRILSSNIGDADDFGGGVELVSPLVSQFTVLAAEPAYSFEIGDTVVIPGAGPSGSALNTTILGMDGYHKQFLLADAPKTSVLAPFMQKTSRIGSVASSFDLQDDNSAILRIIDLQGRVIVLKDGPIFVGTYVGTDGSPIQFQKVYDGPNSIHWKWMLGKVNGSYLVYAGKTGFFGFDLSSATPRQHDKLQMCQTLFYDQATTEGLMDQCWAADNAVTNEIWFVFPSSGLDKGICFDYQYNTCSSIGAVYTAAGSVRKPASGVQTGALEQWFILGNSTGTILQYGMTNLDDGLVWTRNGAQYISTLTSGLVAAGDQFDQKDLRNYILYLSRFPNTPINVTLFGTRNAHEPVTQLFSKTFATPTYKTLIPTYYRKNYYQDQVSVVNSSSNAKIVRRAFELCSIDNRSSTRNDSN